MAPKPKLTDQQTADIRARKAADPTITLGAFADEFGVNVSTISRLLAVEEAPALPALATTSFDKLHASPLNPRKRFDEAALDDLAASIAKEGVLLPLLVRHHPQRSGAFEIIAGERRWRAVGALVRRQLAGSDFPLPYRLIDPCDDRKLLELALTENVARKDMTPLEEAEAFAQLVEEGATPSEIADVVGMTARTVQKRLRLVKDLTPQVREALAAGDITVEFANVLAAYCRKSHQGSFVEKIRNQWYRTSTSLKEELLRFAIPEDFAAFDRSKYTGSWAVDEETCKRYFADPDQFRRLQMKAAKARGGVLQKEFAWVEVWDAAEGKRFSEHGSGFTKKPGHPKAGAIVYVADNGKMEVHQGLVRTKDLEAEQRSAEGKPAPVSEPMTKGHYAHAHRRKTEAMQVAVAQSPVDAMRLVCLALMGGDGRMVKIKAEGVEQVDQVIADPVKATIVRHLSAMPSAMNFQFTNTGVYVGTNWGMNYAGIWTNIAALPEDALTELFSALVALRTGTFSGYNPDLGDEPVAVGIARNLGLVGNEDQVGLGLQAEDLEGLRKEALLSIARAADVGGDLDGMKVGELKEYIAGMAKPGFVLPSVRFGEKKDLEVMAAGKPHPKEVAEAFATSSTRFGLTALLGDQLQDWDPAAKLAEVARGIGDDDYYPGTEGEIRTALIRGINALQRRPLDRRIADTIRFDPEEINVGAQHLIDTLFEIHWKTEDYQDIRTLGDAVAFVCDAFGIAHSVSTSRAAE